MRETMNEAAIDVEGQIAELRRQMDGLMRDRIRPAVGRAAEMADTAIHEMSDAGRDHVATVTRGVRAKPVTSVLVAAGIGYVLGRIFR
jgi:ElaB/YqjD/DUF883 family membrane-anchored ribosome-binding protein